MIVRYTSYITVILDNVTSEKLYDDTDPIDFYQIMDVIIMDIDKQVSYSWARNIQIVYKMVTPNHVVYMILQIKDWYMA